MNYGNGNAPTVLMRRERRSRPTVLSIAGLELPEEILREARDRVRRAVILSVPFSAVMCIGWLLAGLLGYVQWEEAWRLPATTAFALAASAAMGLAVRSKQLSDATIIYLALLFEVVLAGLSGFGHAAHEFQRFGMVSPFGPYALVLVLMPLLLPIPPRLILVSSLASALAAMLGMWIADRQALAIVERATYLEALSICLASAMIAYVASRLVYRLHTEVVTARRLGSYELTELIGQGGMGEVWIARHRLLARPAAIKLIRPESLSAGSGMSPESVHERFTREAKATAALESPHTIRLFDFGVTEEGALYYAMELLDGIDLDSLVATYGPLPAGRVICLLGQVCDSIAEAHEVGLLHRDIKPANIMSCRVGRSFDFVKVLDFGLVTEHAPPSPGAEAAKLTRVGMMVGTPGYMAPEVMLGAPAEPRADIYAIGCVAYRLLTGRAVFEREDVGALALAHVGEPVIPPSELGVEVPPELEALIMACLAKHPAARPQSIEAVAAVLREQARVTPWTQEQARDWWSTARAPRKRNVTISTPSAT